MRQLPNAGTYTARRTGPILVREEESGSLMAYIPYALCDSEIPYSGVHALCLGAKDGTLMTKNINACKTAFGWDGANPFDLENIAIPAEQAPEFELKDCFHDKFDKEDGTEVVTLKASYFNAIGGISLNKEPMSADQRKSALAKWGSKFKAHSGGTPAAKPAATAAVAPAKKPAGNPTASSGATSKSASSGPPGRKATAAQARTATQEEVWTAYSKANPNESQDALGEKFYATVDEVAGTENADAESLSIQQWGQVADKLGV